MDVRGPLRRFCLSLALAVPGLPAAWAGPSDAASVEAALRGRPEEAVVALDGLLSSAQGAARIDALVLKGFMLVRLGEVAEAERV